MSKQKKDSDDDFDDFDDKDEPEQQRNGQGGNPFGERNMGMGDFAGDFGTGMGGGGFGGGMGGMGMGGMGGGFGGGLGGFGGGFDGGFGRMGGMGMGGMGSMGGMGGFGSHMHGPQGMGGPDLSGGSKQPQDNLFSYAKGSSKKQLDKQKAEDEQRRKRKQQEDSQQEKLQKLAKKQDIPLEQQITLVDWSIRGQLQVVRLILEHILIPYKEIKYTFITKDKWQKENLPKLQQKYPNISLPYLQDGQKIICGIEAMIVYVLHKYKRLDLLGSTLEDKIRLATAKTIYWEAVEDYLELCYGQYEQGLSWERAREKYINQRFRVYLNRLVSFLRGKTSGEREILWVDFGIAQLVSLLNSMDLKFKDHNIHIQNYVSRIYTSPQYIVYRKSTRFHERPYNGIGAIYK